MADADSPVADAPAAEPAAPRRSRKMLVLAVLVLVLAGGGGAAWWLLGSSTASAETPKEPALELRGLVTFEPFLVNLADQGGNRFLKATLQLVVPSDDIAAHIHEKPVVMSQLRSAILELLTVQSATALVTPDGKDALKAAIKTRVGQHLTKEQKVIDVLFAEFVVQF
jgi:flagellar FliL protein